MAARILLLISFTGLFATAWNSDGPNGPRAELAANTQRLPDRSDAIDVRTVSDSIVSLSSEFDMSIVSLPETIASGTYRVIDAQGRVGWITVATADQAADNVSTAKPFYATQSENERWYFIRVESAPVIAAPLAESAVRR